MKDIDIIIRKLRTLDSDAADYVQNKYDSGEIKDWQIVNDTRAITWLFNWSDQPQDYEYWKNLYEQYTRLPIYTLTKLGNELQ